MYERATSEQCYYAECHYAELRWSRQASSDNQQNQACPLVGYPFPASKTIVSP